jgi:hypothetical protein
MKIRISNKNNKKEKPKNQKTKKIQHINIKLILTKNNK